MTGLPATGNMTADLLCNEEHQWPTCRSRSIKHLAAVCRAISDKLGLQQGQDWRFVCMGTLFTEMIDNLLGKPVADAPQCDLAGSVITISEERLRNGIEFSRGSYLESIAVLVHSTVRTQCL